MKKPAIVLGLLMALSACATEIEFPAASVMRFENDGTEWVMVGKMYGSIDGSSRYTIAGNGQTCDGTTERQADGDSFARTICVGDDGIRTEFTQVLAKEVVSMSFSGSNVQSISTPQGQAISAFGWGSKADPEFLRSLLD